MRIGIHVSAAGGVVNSPQNAHEVGAEVFQIFSRSPHGGPAKPITKTVQQQFQQAMNKYRFDTFYIHAPYFINLASEKNKIYYGSIAVLREELERGSLLGCKAMMTHIGSFGTLTDKAGIDRVVKAIVKIMEGYKGSAQFLLEMSAGSGRIIGDTFEELAAILFDKRLKKLNLGICLDTCHAFASGYDLRDKPNMERVLKQFDKVIGLKHLILLHANDSKGELGGHLDRHEHIGKGQIGETAFRLLAHNKHLRKLDWILETPKDSSRAEVNNIATLKRLRK